MKKIILFALILTLLSVNTIVFAQTYSFEIGDLNIDTNLFNFNVSFKSNANLGKLTLEFTDADSTVIYYMDEAYCTENDGKYVAAFESFKVKQTMPTGNYFIRIGNHSKGVIEQPIFYVSSYDLKSALDNVDLSTDEAIEEILKTSAGVLKINVESYLSLKDKTYFNSSITGADFQVEDDYSNLENVYDNFLTAYNKHLDLALIFNGNTSDIANVVLNSKYVSVDKNDFFKDLTDKNQVYSLISGVNFLKLDEAEVAKQFDIAVLMSCINQMDPGSFEKLFEYYSSKNIIEINFDDYDRLSDSLKLAVMQNMKNSNISDYTKIPEIFYRIITEVSIPEEPSRPSGGSGDSGKGTSITVGGSALVTPQENNKPDKVFFNDIADVPWAHEAIAYLTNKGVVNGVGNGAFLPNSPVKREEFVKMIVLAFNYEVTDSKVDFRDVDTSNWAYQYISSAKANGLVNGISENEFGFGSEMTREDVATVLYRIYGGNIVDAPSLFNDDENISDYSKNAVYGLAKLGVVAGVDGSFQPKRPITRAECSKLIYKLVEVMSNEKN